MVIEADVAVVGAGIGGVSAAFELTGAGSVVILERETQPAYHTTGRSAAMLLDSYGGAPVRELTRDSGPLFDVRPGILTPRPLLWVAPATQHAGLAALAAEVPALAAVDEPGCRRLFPPLRPGWAVGGLLDAGAREIDVAGLHQYYLGGALRAGARLLLSAPVLDGRHERGRWHLRTGAGEVRATWVVDAAGAWADEVARALGVPPVGLRPLRRTAAVARASGVDPAWPLVADVGETFYLRPEGTGVLVSPADETPSPPCDARPDQLDVALALERVAAATTLGLRSIHTAWAGLRTFAADRAPVLGADPAAPGFCWLAGQGGFGIQVAPAAARLAAAAVTGGEVPEGLSPGRFRSSG
jgi:D-arginine dehydrogenase